MEYHYPQAMRFSLAGDYFVIIFRYDPTILGGGAVRSGDKVELQLEYFEKIAKSNRYDHIYSRTIANEKLLGISYTGRNFITQRSDHNLKLYNFMETTKQYEPMEPYVGFTHITSMICTIDETHFLIGGMIPNSKQRQGVLLRLLNKEDNTQVLACKAMHPLGKYRAFYEDRATFQFKLDESVTDYQLDKERMICKPYRLRCNATDRH